MEKGVTFFLIGWEGDPCFKLPTANLTEDGKVIYTVQKCVMSVLPFEQRFLSLAWKSLASLVIFVVGLFFRPGARRPLLVDAGCVCAELLCVFLLTKPIVFLTFSLTLPSYFMLVF